MRHAQVPPRADPDAGFTLAELLFAVSIMVVVLVGILGALSAATSGSLSSSRRARALSMANNQLEWARNMDYDSVGVPGGDPPGQIPALQSVDGYSVATSVSWAVDTKDPFRSAYKVINVSVSWDDVAPVVVTSAIYGKQRSGAGNVLVTVVDIVTGAKLPGATVSLSREASPGIIYTLTPGAEDGEYAVYDVPSGYAQLTIDKGGYFFDAEAYGSVYVTPGQDNTLTKTVQSTAVTATRHVTVLKTDGSPLEGTQLTLTGPGTDPTGVTDSSGTATFTNLLIGTYSINAAGWTISPPIGITAENYDQTQPHSATATPQ